MRSLRVADVTWPSVEHALRAGATAVLPVGAGAKAHGLHLPMNTDYLQAESLGARLAAAAHVAVWPTLSYGHYPAFLDYPGSCSLARDIFEATSVQIVNDILRAGAARVLIVNTGVSTIASLEAARARCAMPERARLANVYRGHHYLAAAAQVEEQPRGGHADELETSIMLAIAPKCVRMDKAEACLATMRAGPLNRRDPAGVNYSPAGIYGDPRLASRAKGKRLVAAIMADLVAAASDA